MRKMEQYLEQNTVSRWDVVEHIAGEEAQSSARGSLSDNVREVHDGTLDVWEGPGDGSRGCAMAAADVDERSEAVEDGRALAEHDVHDEAGIGVHGVVEPSSDRGVCSERLPHGFAVHHLVESHVGRVVVVLLHPLAHAEHGGDGTLMDNGGNVWAYAEI